MWFFEMIDEMSVSRVVLHRGNSSLVGVWFQGGRHCYFDALVGFRQEALKSVVCYFRHTLRQNLLDNPLLRRVEFCFTLSEFVVSSFTVSLQSNHKVG